MEIGEAIRLIREIKWRSIDKDNMEFAGTINCYQMDAITALVRAAEALNNSPYRLSLASGTQQLLSTVTEIIL